MEAPAAVVPEEEHHELAPQLQFPPGYHFVPTELELLGYLRGKIEGQEHPLAVVNEVAILDWQPGSLVEAYKGYGETKWYFFTVREPSTSNKEEEPNRKVRVPGVKATWKATGSVAHIAAAGASKQQGEGGEPTAADEVIVGTKRVLIYQSSDAEEDGKWSMHEYILKDHAKIGQYALCSIQRKQHSDTMDDAEGVSPKRTDGDPGKAKRRRTKKKLPTQPEGLQLQQLQETASVETPLKPKSRTGRTAGAAAKRKNKAAVQDGEGKQDQEVSSFGPAKAPLTPPQPQAPPQALQQSAPLLPASPLQGYTSSPTDGMLGSSAPMHEEEAKRVNSLEHDDDMTLPYFDFDAFMNSCYQKKQPQTSFDQQSYQQDEHNMFGDHEHLYRELRCFPDNITHDNSSWNDHGRLPNYKNEIIGGAFAAPDQSLYEQMQYYSSPLAQIDYRSPDQFMGTSGGDGAASRSDDGTGLTEGELFAMDVLRDDDHVDSPLALARTVYRSSEQFLWSFGGDGVVSGSDDGMGLTEGELFAMDVLRDDDHVDCLGGAHGGSNNPEAFFQSQDDPLGGSNNPKAFQSQDDPLWSSHRQQQQENAAIGRGQDPPPPSRRISEF